MRIFAVRPIGRVDRSSEASTFPLLRPLFIRTQSGSCSPGPHSSVANCHWLSLHQLFTDFTGIALKPATVLKYSAAVEKIDFGVAFAFFT